MRKNRFQQIPKSPAARAGAKTTELVIGGGVLALLLVGVVLVLVGGRGGDDETSSADAAAVGELGTHKDSVLCVAVSADGSLAASGDADGVIHIWDVESGERTDRLRHDDAVNDLAFSLDGEKLVSAADDGTAIVWNIDDGKELQTLEGHKGNVTAVAFHPSGGYVVTGGEDGRLLMWDVGTGKQFKSFPGHDDEVTAVAFSPTGSRILSGSKDETLLLWSTADDSEEEAELKGHRHAIMGVGFSPDGSRGVSVDEEGSLRTWHLARGKEESETDIELDKNVEITGLAVSPGGTQAIVSCSDDVFRVCDLESGSTSIGPEGHTDAVSGSAVTSDASFLFTSSFDESVRIWKLSTPSKDEVAGISERADVLEDYLDGLKRYAKHMKRGREALDDEDLDEAKEEFAAARKAADPDTAEYAAADEAFTGVEQAGENKEEYTALLKSGKAKLERRDYKGARTDFLAAKKLYPKRTEADEGLAKTDKALKLNDLLATAIKDRTDLRFDYDRGEKSNLENSLDFVLLYDPQKLQGSTIRSPFRRPTGTSPRTRPGIPVPRIPFLRRPVPNKPDTEKSDSEMTDSDRTLFDDLFSGSVVVQSPIGSRKSNSSAPLGLPNSTLSWKLDASLTEPLSEENLTIRVELTIDGNETPLAVKEYALAKGERTFTFQGTATAPESGWEKGDYRFRKYLVTDDTKDELDKADRFSLGHLNWKKFEVSLSPQKVQQSDRYRFKTGLQVQKDEPFEMTATGTITPASSAFYRQIFPSVRVTEAIPIGPEGLAPPKGQRYGRLYGGKYRPHTLRTADWAALIFQATTEPSTDWFPYRKGKVRGLGPTTAELTLSINSIVAEIHSVTKKLKPIPQTRHTYWVDNGAFEVKAYSGRFDFDTELSRNSKLALLYGIFWK